MRGAGGVVIILCGICCADALGAWQLTFEDNFDGTSVNTSTWTSGYWFGQVPINSELQAYIPEANTVSNGQLHITARHEQHAYGDQTMQYTSGALTTINSFSQQYGRFEMRAKIPTGKGYWPAFWLLPSDKSWPPEIDVMEILGDVPGKVYMTTHYKDVQGNHQAEGGNWTGPDFSAGFHTYAIEWDATSIRWYIDDVQRFTSAHTPTANGSFYMLVNLAVGGGWPGSPDANTAFPQSYDIDYVRAFTFVVPEPATLALLALAAPMLMSRRLTRRRRRPIETAGESASLPG